MIELVGRSDSNWAGDSASRQNVAGHHCNVQGVMLCDRSLMQTAISLSSCEAEVFAAIACTETHLGHAELSDELHYKVSVRLQLDSDSARQVLQ